MIAVVQNILAGVKRHSGDESAMPSFEDLAVAVQLADVEAITEDVRESRAVKSRLGGLIHMSFTLELVGERLEGVIAACVELEYANQRSRLFRMWLNGFIAILDVDIAIGRNARRPALADLLVHALENFGAQVVAVVLGNGSHHVEAQCVGRTWSELVLDEFQLHTMGVFKFLQANCVAGTNTLASPATLRPVRRVRAPFEPEPFRKLLTENFR